LYDFELEGMRFMRRALGEVEYKIPKENDNERKNTARSVST